MYLQSDHYLEVINTQGSTVFHLIHTVCSIVRLHAIDRGYWLLHPRVIGSPYVGLYDYHIACYNLWLHVTALEQCLPHGRTWNKACEIEFNFLWCDTLTLKVLVATIDAQWEGIGDVGSARYEPALLPPCPTIRI